MTITINGTTGIAGVDGSAGTPAVQGTDTNTGIFFPAADTIAFGEGGAEVARFDSSGNLLVNTTTAQTGAKLAVTGGIQGTITSGTSVTASGTSVDFTGIPSWVKRITVMLAGVSTNGTSIPQIQLGYSGGVEITGYVSGAFTSNTNNSTSTTGFLLGGASTAAYIRSGNAQICLIGSNLWSFSYSGGVTVSTSGDVSGGHKTTTGTLDRIRITTVNGTDTFDAGTINILYEG